MNKLFIVLLAVCLVSVHAFVKRETEPEKKDGGMDDITKNLQELGKNVNDQLSKAFDPEQLKKGFNDLVDKINQGINEFKSKSEAPKQ